MTLSGRHFVEAITETPRGTSAEGGHPGMRALVGHAGVEPAEAAPLAGAHRATRGSPESTRLSVGGDAGEVNPGRAVLRAWTSRRSS
jgi:hypothetical protein